MARRVQNIGEGIVSVRTRSNSGSKANIAFTIASATAAAVMAVGAWSGFRLNASPPEIDVSKVLKGVEDHYNHTQSLRVAFTETLTQRGRKHTDTGELFLRKPGRMRWQYTSPAGKLFISDGKFTYLFLPAENRALRTPFRETEDVRAPLAFLLGKLNFQNDFREFRSQPDHENVFITAIPKSDKLPYSEVTFLISPDSVIHWLSVKEQDNSTLDYGFQSEKTNPPIADSLFHFVPPPGVEYVDAK
jgi:outer membrane lipoprotein carrier protein